ncbi:MAG: alpha/beta hydrolase [Acidobacteria bacterium]|nr:alpha/beta hydrolase [Acidobacteriota bacterium]
MEWRIWGGGLVLGWGLLAWMANRSAYFPMKYPGGEWDEQERIGAEEVWIDSGGVRLNGWWRARPGAQCAVLFLHGNAGNVSHRSGAMEDFAAAGAAALVIDYRGYGKSAGWPTERGLYADGEAGYQWLLKKGWKGDRIVVVGESLGTTVAVDLAARRQVAALVLEAPFPSARAVARRILPWLGPGIVWGFNAKSKLASVRAPLLVIHGAQDEVIDYELGVEVFRAAREPKELWTIVRGHHNDLHVVERVEYRRKLRDLMMATCNAATSSPPRS